MPELDGDAGLLEAAVREAGGLARSLIDRQVRNWNKPDGSPVTEADVAVDALLRRRLLGARPGYGWLSEETPDDGSRLTRERSWIADPIDGTRSFIRGGDAWCIGAALLDRGRPVLAAVYRPVPDHLYLARLNSGARLNGATIRVGNATGLAGARIIGSRKALARFSGLGIIADTNTDIPLLLRLCRVAAGAIDGAYSPGRKNDWDLAAGDLIVHEAGGCVTGLDGATYAYNRPQAHQAGLAAANGCLHGAIIAAGGT